MARRNGDEGVFTARNRLVAQTVSLKIRAAASLTQDEMASLMGQALSAGSGSRGETVPWGKWERGELGMKPSKAHQVVSAAVKMKIINIESARRLGLRVARSADSSSEMLPSTVARLSRERLEESRRFASAKAALASVVMRFDEVCRDLKHHRVVDVGEDGFDCLLDLAGYDLLSASEMEAAEKLSDAAVFRSLEPASVLLAQLARQHVEPVETTCISEIAGLSRMRSRTLMTRKQEREEKEFFSSISVEDLIANDHEDWAAWSTSFGSLVQASIPRTFATVRKTIERSLTVPKLSQANGKMTKGEARRGKGKPV